jgi:hypothetical protein
VLLVIEGTHGFADEQFIKQHLEGAPLAELPSQGR